MVVMYEFATFLFQAGNYVRDDSVPNLIHLLSATDKMHSYAAQKLYQALLEDSDLSRQPLAQVNYLIAAAKAADVLIRQ